MIQSFGLEFDSEDEMLAAVNRLWNQNKMTGEIEMLPLGNGAWRLNVHSEKQLRESLLESLPGKRVKARSIMQSDGKRELQDDDEGMEDS